MKTNETTKREEEKDEEKNISSPYSRSFNYRSYGWKRVRGRHRSAG